MTTTTHPAPPPSRSRAAQRQWQYRQRRKRDMGEAIGHEAEASRVTLVALLAYELAVLEDRNTPERRIETARNVARRTLSDIITRHAIEL